MAEQPNNRGSSILGPDLSHAMGFWGQDSADSQSWADWAEEKWEQAKELVGLSDDEPQAAENVLAAQAAENPEFREAALSIGVMPEYLEPAPASAPTEPAAEETLDEVTAKVEGSDLADDPHVQAAMTPVQGAIALSMDDLKTLASLSDDERVVMNKIAMHIQDGGSTDQLSLLGVLSGDEITTAMGLSNEEKGVLGRIKGQFDDNQTLAAAQRPGMVVMTVADMIVLNNMDGDETAAMMQLAQGVQDGEVVTIADMTDHLDVLDSQREKDLVQGLQSQMIGANIIAAAQHEDPEAVAALSATLQGMGDKLDAEGGPSAGPAAGRGTPDIGDALGLGFAGLGALGMGPGSDIFRNLSEMIGNLLQDFVGLLGELFTAMESFFNGGGLDGLQADSGRSVFSDFAARMDAEFRLDQQTYTPADPALTYAMVDHDGTNLGNLTAPEIRASSYDEIDAKVAEETGVSADYLARLRNYEFSSQCYAKSPYSSACGLHQFIESTWLDTIKKHGDKIPGMEEHAEALRRGDTSARDEILAKRFDPEVSTYAAAYHTKDNIDYLERGFERRGMDVEVTGAMAYMAHQQGMGTALTTLTADLNTHMRDLVSDAAYRGNPNMHGTAGEYVAHVTTKFGGDRVMAGGDENDNQIAMDKDRKNDNSGPSMPTPAAPTGMG